MRNKLTAEQWQAVKIVAERYKMPEEMATEYVEEWLIHTDGVPILSKECFSNRNIAYLFINLGMSVPAAVEAMEILTTNYDINVTRELPGTIWTCLYSNGLDLKQARRAFKYYREHGADDYESREYDEYLALVEAGLSAEEALKVVYCEEVL